MFYWEIESLFILQSLGTRLSMYNTCTSKLNVSSTKYNCLKIW